MWRYYLSPSIVIGVGITDMPPGSVKGLQMVVEDVKAVRDELVIANSFNNYYILCPA